MSKYHTLFNMFNKNILKKIRFGYSVHFNISYNRGPIFPLDPLRK